MLVATAATLALKPRRQIERLAPGMLDRAIPTTIGPWKFVTASGLVVPPQDELTDQIYDQVLTRVYAGDGLPGIMLLIAYGSAQDYTLQAHLPEVCYPSSGYTVRGIERVPVSLRQGQTDVATILSAERSDRTEQVFYWVRIGDRFPATLAQERIAVMSANLHGVLPDGVLVRISTLGEDRRAALSQIGAFNRRLRQSLGQSGRKLLGTSI